MKARALLAAIGYILSPLSFWNDIYVNIPIAYAFGYLLSLFASRSFFLPGMIAGYLISNIAGLVLMHLALSQKKAYTKKNLLSTLAFSLAYTLLIIILFFAGILVLPESAS